MRRKFGNPHLKRSVEVRSSPRAFPSELLWLLRRFEKKEGIHEAESSEIPV